MADTGRPTSVRNPEQTHNVIPSEEAGLQMEYGPGQPSFQEIDSNLSRVKDKRRLRILE